MKKNAPSTTKARLLPDGTIVRVEPDGSTTTMSDASWEKADAMTEAEINAAALSDPDAFPVTPEDVPRFRRVVDLKAIRQQLHLTQEQFAATFHLPISTLRDWEQHRVVPDQAARTLLCVIAKNPEAVKNALEPARL